MGERGFRNRAMLNQIATGVIYVGLLPSSCGGNIQLNLNRLCQQVIALNRLGFDQIVITIGKTVGVVGGVGRVRRINDAACVSCQARLYKNPAFSAVKTCFFDGFSIYNRRFSRLGFTVQVKHNAGQWSISVFRCLFHLDAKAVHNSAVLNGVRGSSGSIVAIDLIGVCKFCVIRVAVAADYSGILYNSVVGNGHRVSGTSLYCGGIEFECNFESICAFGCNRIIRATRQVCCAVFNFDAAYIILQTRRRVGDGKGGKFLNVLRDFNRDFVRNGIADTVRGILRPAGAIVDFLLHIGAVVGNLNGCIRSGCIFAYLNLTIILHGKGVVFRIQDIALVSRITAVCILKNAVVALRKPCNCNFTAWVRCQIVGVAIAIVCSNVCPICAILFL